jgi:ArsR family transcriptional regulator
MTQACTRCPPTPRHAAARCGPIDELLDPALFKALCDPTRARLLACLAKCARPCTVSELGECCSVDLSVVSRHLHVLRRAGVLDAQRDGREVRYAVRSDDLCRSLRGLADALERCARPSPVRRVSAAVPPALQGASRARR